MLSVGPEHAAPSQAPQRRRRRICWRAITPPNGVTVFDVLALRLAHQIASSLAAVVVLDTGLGLSACAHAAISGGAGEKEAVVKVTRGKHMGKADFIEQQKSDNLRSTQPCKDSRSSR